MQSLWGETERVHKQQLAKVIFTESVLLVYDHAITLMKHKNSAGKLQTCTLLTMMPARVVCGQVTSQVNSTHGTYRYVLKCTFCVLGKKPSNNYIYIYICMPTRIEVSEDRLLV